MKLLPLLIECGLTLCTDGERLIVTPASEITDPLRELIRNNKADLLIAVRAAEIASADLVAAIDRCCDMRGDDDRNRAGLIAEASDFTPEQQRDLTEHFDEQAGIWQTARGT